MRGEATRDSDVDLVVAFAPEATISLTGVASLRSELSDLLAQRVDLAERRTLRPHLRETAERGGGCGVLMARFDVRDSS